MYPWRLISIEEGCNYRKKCDAFKIQNNILLFYLSHRNTYARTECRFYRCECFLLDLYFSTCVTCKRHNFSHIHWYEKKILLYLCLRQIIKNKLKLNRHKQAICHIPGITKLSRRFYTDWLLILLLLLCKYIFHLHMYVRMYIYMFSRF